MKNKIMTLNILGTDYVVYTNSANDDETLKKNDGYVLPEKHIIVLDESNSTSHQEHVLTHEMVHAFLYESGLSIESRAENEEIVDWIALQISKINNLKQQAIKNLKQRSIDK